MIMISSYSGENVQYTNNTCIEENDKEKDKNKDK